MRARLIFERFQFGTLDNRKDYRDQLTEVNKTQTVPLSKLVCSHSKTSFEKNCFSAWASTLNMGLINKVDMVCLSPVGYGV